MYMDGITNGSDKFPDSTRNSGSDPLPELRAFLYSLSLTTAKMRSNSAFG